VSTLKRTADKDRKTPLFRAAQGVLKVQLERNDVTPNTSNQNWTMPVSIAAWKRDEGVVKRLQEPYDVDSNTTDKYAETPYCWTCAMGTKQL